MPCRVRVTPASLPSDVAAARSGAVICLASGDYSAVMGTSRPAPGITITSAPGATVTFSSGLTLDLGTIHDVTFDGTGGGGTMRVGGALDMETPGDGLQARALNLTFQNIDFAAGGTVLIRGPENSGIVFDRDTFVAGDANCANGGSPSGLSGIFSLLYDTAPSTTQSGVTIENSVFVAPADLWNPYRAIQTGAPMTVENNVFAGFLDHTESGGCNHIDTLQLFSGAPGTQGRVRFTGNLCYDDYGCVEAFDGTSKNSIADNACFDIERACFSLYSDSGSVIDHNTQQAGGADPAGCATEPNTQPCGSATLLENGNKGGDPVPQGEVFTNNVGVSPPNVEAGSLSVNSHNVWSGASSPNINGSATFAGGAHPISWAGFELTPGSTGHGAGSDGQDVGIRGGAGGPPTGGGSAPVNTSAPALSGLPVQGQTLSSTAGTWSITGYVPTVTTYMWWDCPSAAFSARSCTPIQPHTAPVSANGSSYTVQASDVGSYIFSQVTVTNANGQITATSRSKGPVGR